MIRHGKRSIRTEHNPHLGLEDDRRASKNRKHTADELGIPKQVSRCVCKKLKSDDITRIATTQYNTARCGRHDRRDTMRDRSELNSAGQSSKQAFSYAQTSPPRLARVDEIMLEVRKCRAVCRVSVYMSVLAACKKRGGWSEALRLHSPNIYLTELPLPYPCTSIPHTPQSGAAVQPPDWWTLPNVARQGFPSRSLSRV